MKDAAINILIFLCMVCLGFGRFTHGMGMQTTTEGAGVYYKRLWALTDNSQLIGDMGFHFANSNLRIDIFGYAKNSQTMMFDLTSGFRHELFSSHFMGPFRLICIVGTGGMSDLKSFSKNNIVGIWMIKYMLGLGVYFYNLNIMNEVTLKFIHSEAINGHAAFQIAFYWK